ncbi:antibiotic biosynthesis monooxygenase [Stella sp.]|uniref:antibiotic biosynthesis monooxygenase family protein n=1 Tax=Stella sp. TaxID=2912054 RepID=UPI0035AF5440
MIAVMFEVEMVEGRAERYFELAAALRREAEQIDGFLSVERFESLSRPGRYVSLSFWRDMAAVDRWRAHAQHRAAQAEGKESIIRDFRIRVAEVVRDYTLADRKA